MDKQQLVYLDNCIINEVVRNRSFGVEHKKIEDDLAAFCSIALSLEANKFVMSPHSKTEFSQTPKESIREKFLKIYEWMNNVSSSEHELMLFPAARGTPHMLPGGFNVVFPRNKLLGKLESIFDAPDAKHIFQAAAGGCTHFLTIDYASILRRIPSNRSKLDEICPNLVILSPSDFMASLKP